MCPVPEPTQKYQSSWLMCLKMAVILSAQKTTKNQIPACELYKNKNKNKNIFSIQVTLLSFWHTYTGRKMIFWWKTRGCYCRNRTTDLSAWLEVPCFERHWPPWRGIRSRSPRQPRFPRRSPSTRRFARRCDYQPEKFKGKKNFTEYDHFFSRIWKGMILCWDLRGPAWFSWARVSAERGERCPRTRDFPWAGSARQTPECTWTLQRCRWWVSLPSGCLFENSPAEIPHSTHQQTFYKENENGENFLKKKIKQKDLPLRPWKRCLSTTPLTVPKGMPVLVLNADKWTRQGIFTTPRKAAGC